MPIAIVNIAPTTSGKNRFNSSTKTEIIYSDVFLVDWLFNNDDECIKWHTEQDVNEIASIQGNPQGPFLNFFVTTFPAKKNNNNIYYFVEVRKPQSVTVAIYVNMCLVFPFKAHGSCTRAILAEPNTTRDNLLKQNTLNQKNIAAHLNNFIRMVFSSAESCPVRQV